MKCWRSLIAGRLGWIAATFLDGEDAEMDLSMDRPKFLQRRDIMALIPKHIKRHITHSGDNGQIHGFQELFLYLEKSAAAMDLRQLVAAYFASSPELRSHLSMSSVTVGDHKSQYHWCFFRALCCRPFTSAQRLRGNLGSRHDCSPISRGANIINHAI